MTGFDAFGGQALNPSWLAVQALHGRRIAGHRIVSARIPTVFGTALEHLQTLMMAHRPTLVVCVGQAGGRAALSLERVAINLIDARIADNAQAQPAGTFVCNQVFYGLMHCLATQRGWRRVRGGFIHVPWLPEQGTPSMPLEGIVHGLRLAVRVALTTSQDLRIAAGQTH